MPKQLYIILRDDHYDTAQYFLRRRQAKKRLIELQETLIKKGATLLSSDKRSFTVCFGGNYSFQSHYRIIIKEIMQDDKV